MVAAIAAAVLFLPIALFLVRVVVTGLDTPTDSTPSETSASPPTTVRAPADATTVVALPDALGPVVHLAAGGEHAVGGLDPDSVLQLRVSGFFEFARARVRQCVGVDAAVCGNEIQVQFDVDGAASFQYLVVEAAGPGSCRLRSAPCFIVIDQDDDARTVLRTLFHDALPPEAMVRVEPASRLKDAQTVRVSVEGLPPFATANVVLCSLPVDRAADRCGIPGVVVPITADAQGAAAADYAVKAGPVGRERVPCGRGSNCAVAVVSDSAFVRAQPVRVVFAKPAGAQYGGLRLALGLAAALLLLALGTWLVVRTDWSPVGEEAAPEIDDAEYADLDAIIAALPPEEALEPSH